ncbi:ATP-binding protein [Streptomyces megasporus]|uniref:ATP-binding protein n=1 Tax=Streptomyces megasporus TaxID=44060 RepID=UPI00068D1E8D|nr:ATP-binding protein [Streptomyces megasporus]
MDPNHPGAEDRDSGGITRAIPVIAGEYLLTINPVDGSEIEPCPPGEHPGTPRRRTADSRAERERAVMPPVPAGTSLPDPPLLEREEERERLVRLLRRGRSVRLTGPRGSGRTALLAAVAAECADLAPDGVVRLSGCRRTPDDLLYDLFAAVHDAPRHRPDRAELSEALRGVGAVVLLDDVEFGGRGLDTLLDATPECAFLISATPDTPAPSADAPLEEVSLSGIGRVACLELMEHIVDRPLTDEEAKWAADLWFECEGLPLRFVQAGALLRQRDTADAPFDDAEGAGVGLGKTTGGKETDARSGGPLPRFVEGAVPAPLLAAGLPEVAREVLRFAVALGGVLPDSAHLPALVDDARADTALGELLARGLVTAAGAHHRLAHGVADQLADAGYDDGADGRAHTVARHYAWWTGHPSVTPERVARETEAILAAVQGARRGGHASAAVLLARKAAPLLAASLYWSAWERVLRGGQEAARTAGEVAEEAYFHHDLGVLALCTGNLDRARAELEASIGLRGVLADRRGTVAGRRALALVEDRSMPRPAGGAGGAPENRAPAAGLAKTHAVPPVSPAPAPARPTPQTPPQQTPPRPTRERPAAEQPSPVPPSVPRSTDDTAALDKLPPTPPPTLPPALAVPPVTVGSAFDEPSDTGALTRPTPVVRDALGGNGTAGVGGARPDGARRLALLGARRNILAAGAGALLAVAVGTVVTLGMTSDGEEPAGSVNPAVTSREDEGITVDDPAPSSDGRGERTSEEGGVPSDSGTPSVSGTPSADASSSASPEESEEEESGGAIEEDTPQPSKTSSKPTSKKPTDPRPTEPEESEDTPTEPADTPTEPSPPSEGSDPPTVTNSASGPSDVVTHSAAPTGGGSVPAQRDAGEDPVV